MTDYLEEHLENADALLKRVQEMERSTSGLPYESALDESAEDSMPPDEDAETSAPGIDTVSESEEKVDSLEKRVDQIKEMVDKSELDSDLREEAPNSTVNRQAEYGDEIQGQDAEQTEDQSETEEREEARTNAGRAENRTPLSAQLEELDRAVSSLTALFPEGQGTGSVQGHVEGRRDGFPVSLAGPRSPAGYPSVSGSDGSGLGGMTSPGSAAGGDLDWAEQADRIFRRDSRRYDGGFYLY